jgi:uncharacterized protein YjiS (DUF1127 family)
MLILHILRVLRIVARLRKRRRKAAELFVRLDRRTLADIGIGPGTMVSLARRGGNAWLTPTAARLNETEDAISRKRASLIGLAAEGATMTQTTTVSPDKIL